METKKVCFTEVAYVVGIIALALGTALMERAELGISMVVAPAYLLHLKISQYFPAYSFGMSEYVFQAFLIIVMSVVLRRFKKSYLFSFVTAVFYGLVLDLCIRIVGFIPWTGMVWKIAYYLVGLLLCATGVAFLFHTYISLEAYELFVKELSAKYSWRIDWVKTVYDCCSCLLGILLSFLFFGFGHFEGVKIGTLICALINGWLIGKISIVIEARYNFTDGLSLRGRETDNVRIE